MPKKTVEDIDPSGKRALVRVDFNVPQDEEGKITDDTRIVAALPTIQYLMKHGAKVILISHLGRPKGKRREELRMEPVAQCLEGHLGQPVLRADDCIGPQVKEIISQMSSGEVLLLENVRFHPAEEANDPAFAQELAELADIYVNDAFGTAHRAHASTTGIANYLPAVAGFLLNKEIEVMGKALENPERPFVVLLGGAKVSGKIMAVENLLPKADCLLIGGGMSYTFLKAKGYEVGKSILDPEHIEAAGQIMNKAREMNRRLELPVDVMVAKELTQEAERKVVPADAMPADWAGVDIGPETRELFADALKDAKTVIWNGPVGLFEVPAFAEGTRAMAQAIVDSGATSIVGGGDSGAAMKQMGFADKMTHVSTGGGATLELLEGKSFPGVEALPDK